MTISGGKLKRAISEPFSAPPANPNSNAIPAASAIGSCASRQSAPNTTATSPIIDPTERSIPPVMITKVKCKGQQPDFNTQPRDLECIRCREKVVAR